MAKTQQSTIGISIKITTDQKKLIEKLIKDTGLTRSGVVKLALTELGKQRGIS
jgi:antitoxin component of RelBE/YafQ-DinJ toxin-antitoxin module